MVEPPQPRHDPRRSLLDAPPSQTGVGGQHAVEDQGREELLGLLVDDHEVLAPDVLSPTEEVRDRSTVLVERRLEGPTPTPDVDHEGDPAVLEQRPHAVVVGVGGRQAPARMARKENGARTEVQCLLDGPMGQRRIQPERLGHRHEAIVIGAERGHGSVVGLEPSGDQFDVAPGELPGREGGEHQLALEAEQVEGPAALPGVEGTEARPSLRVHEAGFGPQGATRVVAPGRGRLDRLDSQGPGAPQGERSDPLADTRGRELLDPVRQLHDVAVGVVVGTAFGVRHGVPHSPPDSPPAAGGARVPGPSPAAG